MALTPKQISSAPKRRERLLAICEQLPEVEVQPVGEEHLQFQVRKKTFLYYMFDHHGNGRIAAACKSTKEEQGRLVTDDPEHFFVPAYLGPSGWIGIYLDTGRVDWEVVGMYAAAAWRMVAPKRLLENL
ncbi:MAG TPA: MmcQ/YjbR family DNA-binding protein [Candidatus Kapabacteria bacterium]|nr:MmcQ/YjbR family DNA-binding protein [Candidatus Kapabacteria bacterium]